MKTTTKLCGLLMLSIGLSAPTQAQKALYVKEKTGANTAFNLSTIKMVTFVGGNMVVSKRNAADQSFAITGIKQGYFDVAITTGTEAANAALRVGLSLFPNPASDQLQVRYFSEKAENVQLQVLDIQGKLIYQQAFTSQVGVNTQIVSIAQFGRGMYLCRVQQADRVEMVKFLKK